MPSQPLRGHARPLYLYHAPEPRVDASSPCWLTWSLLFSPRISFILGYNGFIFANVPEDPKDLEVSPTVLNPLDLFSQMLLSDIAGNVSAQAVAAFPRALANHARDFSFSGTKYCADPSKSGTGRRALAELLPHVHCYTLEVSFFCSSSGHVRGDPYTPSSYTDMGQGMGCALHEYFSGLDTVTRGDATPHKEVLQKVLKEQSASHQLSHSATQHQPATQHQSHHHDTKHQFTLQPPVQARFTSNRSPLAVRGSDAGPSGPTSAMRGASAAADPTVEVEAGAVASAGEFLFSGGAGPPGRVPSHHPVAVAQGSLRGVAFSPGTERLAERFAERSGGVASVESTRREGSAHGFRSTATRSQKHQVRLRIPR